MSCRLAKSELRLELKLHQFPERPCSCSCTYPRSKRQPILHSELLDHHHTAVDAQRSRNGRQRDEEGIHREGGDPSPFEWNRHVVSVSVDISDRFFVSVHNRLKDDDADRDERGCRCD